ncbi:hypothetical protein MPSEU_000889600 [Mayamaea pseudoterrestris]|nr:hypothetical protein MPSEU_000889600 [Mayamaea pseudoterrestris]
MSRISTLKIHGRFILLLQTWIVTLRLLQVFSFQAIHSNTRIGTEDSILPVYSQRPLHSAPKSSMLDDQIKTSLYLSPDIIDALDLDALMQRIASHAGTKRGRQAILSTISNVAKGVGQQSTATASSRRLSASPSSRRKAWLTHNEVARDNNRREQFTMPVAASAQEARCLYDLLEQAMFGLQGTNNATAPPLYATDSYDDSTIDDTDDDEWLEYTNVDEFTLEDIIKAEQVVKRLLGVSVWARQESTLQWMPLLADIALRMDHESLQALYETLHDAVEIVRVRSVLDVTAKSSYLFRLKESSFPALAVLRAKERDMQAKQTLTSKKAKKIQMNLKQYVKRLLPRNKKFNNLSHTLFSPLLTLSTTRSTVSPSLIQYLLKLPLRYGRMAKFL